MSCPTMNSGCDASAVGVVRRSGRISRVAAQSSGTIESPGLAFGGKVAVQPTCLWFTTIACWLMIPNIT